MERKGREGEGIEQGKQRQKQKQKKGNKKKKEEERTLKGDIKEWRLRS